MHFHRNVVRLPRGYGVNSHSRKTPFGQAIKEKSRLPGYRSQVGMNGDPFPNPGHGNHFHAPSRNSPGHLTQGIPYGNV